MMPNITTAAAPHPRPSDQWSVGWGSLPPVIPAQARRWIRISSATLRSRRFPPRYRVSCRAAKSVFRGRPRHIRPIACSTPLLPGCMRITEEGLHAQRMELVVAGELGPIVEGDRLAPRGGQGPQALATLLGDRRGRFPRGPDREQQARVALMQGEHRLAIGAERHQIGLPVPRGLAVGQRTPEVDQGSRTTAAALPPAPFPLGAGPVVAPSIVLLRACDLGVDEAVAGLVGEHRLTSIPLEPAGHLLLGPALFEASEHLGAERGIPVEAGAPC